MQRWPVLLVVLAIAAILERDFRVDAAVLAGTSPFGGPQLRYPLIKAPQGFVFKPLDNPQPKRHRQLSCPKAAVNSYQPICGWEPASQTHRTFANECEMHRVSRITATHWISIRSGACTKSMMEKMKRSSLKARSRLKSGKAIPCPKVYNPVCAHLQGVKSTFHNECLVNAENINTGNEWEVFSKGICEEDFELRDEIKKTHTVRKRSVFDTHDSKMDIDFDNDRSSVVSFKLGGMQSDGVNVKDAESWMSDNQYADEEWTMYDDEPPLDNEALIEELHIGETKVSFTDASDGHNLASALEREGEHAAKQNVLSDEVGSSLFNDEDLSNEYEDDGDAEYSVDEQTNGSETAGEISLLESALEGTSKNTSDDLRSDHQRENNTALTTNNQIEDRGEYSTLVQNWKENVEAEDTYNVQYSEDVQYDNEDLLTQFIISDFDEQLQDFESERILHLPQEDILEKTLQTYKQSPKAEELPKHTNYLNTASTDSEHTKDIVVKELQNEPQRFDIFADIIDIGDEELRPIGKRQVKAEVNDGKKMQENQLIPTNDTANENIASNAIQVNMKSRAETPNSPALKYKAGHVSVTFPKAIPWMKKYVKSNKMQKTSMTQNISTNFTKVHSENCKYGNTTVCARNANEFQTFANMCDLITRNTITKSNWSYLHNGNCDNCHRNCTEEHQPVCATRNGVKLTFTNECHLNEMICKNKSVEWTVLGKEQCLSRDTYNSTEGPTKAPDSNKDTEMWFQYRFKLPKTLLKKNG